jgi:hypothetical protein
MRLQPDNSRRKIRFPFLPDASELANAAADAKRLKPTRLNHFFAIGQAISALPPICNKYTDLMLIQIVFSLAHFEQMPRFRIFVSLRLMKLLQRNFRNSSGDMPLPVSDQPCVGIGQRLC